MKLHGAARRSTETHLVLIADLEELLLKKTLWLMFNPTHTVKKFLSQSPKKRKKKFMP